MWLLGTNSDISSVLFVKWTLLATTGSSHPLMIFQIPGFVRVGYVKIDNASTNPGKPTGPYGLAPRLNFQDSLPQNILS